MTHPQGGYEPPSLTQIADKLPVLEEQVKTAVSELKADRAERIEYENSVRSAIRLGALVIAVLTLLAVVIAYGVWNIIDGRSISRDAQRQIYDCINPDGQCFREAAERADEQTKSIARIVAEMQTDLNACTYRAESEYRACADLAMQGLTTR